MSLDSLQSLLLDEIKDIYSAEKQLVKALPKVAKATCNKQLKSAVEEHLEETQGQVERLEKVFECLGQSPKTKHCKAMEGLIDECAEVLEEEADPMVLDAAIITACQKVEHYEIAAYGSARAHAELLGLSDVVELLQETLEEEKGADEKLNSLAQETINFEAAGKEANNEESRNETDISQEDEEDDTSVRQRMPDRSRSSTSSQRVQ